MNLNGFESLALGARPWGIFILTVFRNLRNTWKSLPMYLELLRGSLIEPYILTWKSVIATLKGRSGWTTEVSSTFRFWLNSSKRLILDHPYEAQNELITLLRRLLQSAQILLVANGALAPARRILVQISGSMASASYVGNLIEPKTTQQWGSRW